MTKESLQARLARSLDRANSREAKTPTQARTIVPAAPGGKGAKLSISLFASDLARLDAIRSYMAARGQRISTSQAVKLALRTAPLSTKLTAALDAVRKEDGRGVRQFKRHK